VGTYASLDRDGTITQGGYSTHIVVDEDFVLRMPVDSVREGRSTAVRGHHHLLTTAALGVPGRARRSRS
jgi:hypothetical protein